MKDSNNRIKEIRLLPMSKKVFSSYDEVIDFLCSSMHQRDGLYYYKRRNIKCEDDVLVLFQYDNMLVASAVLIEQAEKEIIDSEDEKYNGYYRFDRDTIQRFEQPITSEELMKIDSSFHGFNQSTCIFRRLRPTFTVKQSHLHGKIEPSSRRESQSLRDKSC